MALKQKKFGAFAGVFTPSILTILGVIMYMRLGWITAQAGLIQVLLIILLAHVISVTTGLSISSIATDKKIRTGGIYYILSRSLGLPFGGALGITMFIGTALSISLYIIGFAENFLGIESIRNFLGMGETLHDYRIVGTAVILLLTFIALIGTAVAIKTQFFILGAIAISLVSVIIGLLSNGPEPSGPSIMPAAERVPFEVIFAIFFPAVTGFTAGVAMSGDLKDPRKDIPMGTMASIGTGLVVYIALAVAFAFFVDRGLMLSDNNFLMKIAVYAPLVVAGIWGATLSSAIGGLLGGPRILQAMSNDYITPKIFGKGQGINNEPRNALLLTFLIAEGGILIGSLDVIASIVSMFYIAAYGFINLSFALEKWASSDFRPSFKISKWVGIIGFVASFLVMFKIDSTAMLFAILILWGIYYFVKKKELELDFGDVWQSVWSSIIRTTLNTIDKKGLEERNWRPNIILFSGGTTNRPHLIHFGKDLVTNQGLLSNFDLILNRSSRTLLKKHQQAVNDDEDEGIFTRRHECNDIYEGIETISGTYGFSGIEPNTVLMGWARQSEDPVRFVKMIKTLSDLDLNIIMLDYDKNYGFGQYKTVDVWCRGGGNNCNLVIALVKFMWMSERWREAKLRILLINPVNEERDRLYEDTYQILERLRINAEVKIINNQIEQRPVNEIIQIESQESDLIFLGIPDVQPGQEYEYVDTINHLCHNIGTVALVKASSYFKEFEIGSARQKFAREKSEIPAGKSMKAETRLIKTPEVRYPESPVPAEYLRVLYERTTRIDEGLYKKYFKDIFSHHYKTLDEISRIIDKYFKRTEDHFIKEAVFPSGPNFYTSFLNEITDYIKEQPEEVFEEQKTLIFEALEAFMSSFTSLTSDQPEFIDKQLTAKDLSIKWNDSRTDILFKSSKLPGVISSGKPLNYKIRYKELLDSYFPNKAYASLHEVIQNWGLISLQFVHKTKQFIKAGIDEFMALENLSRKGSLTLKRIQEVRGAMDDYYTRLRKLNEDSMQSLYKLLLNKNVYIIQQLSNDIIYPNTNKKIVRRESALKKAEKDRQEIRNIPDLWYANQLLHNNLLILHQQTLLVTTKLRITLNDLQSRIEEKYQEDYFPAIEELVKNSDWENRNKEQKKAELQFIFDEQKLIDFWEPLVRQAEEDILEECFVFNEEIKVFPPHLSEEYKDVQFSRMPAFPVKARTLISKKVSGDFILPVRTSFDKMIKTLIALPENLYGNHMENGNESLAEENSTSKNPLDILDKIKSRIIYSLQERSTAIGDVLSFGALMNYLYKESKRK